MIGLTGLRAAVILLAALYLIAIIGLMAATAF